MNQMIKNVVASVLFLIIDFLKFFLCQKKLYLQCIEIFKNSIKDSRELTQRLKTLDVLPATECEHFPLNVQLRLTVL